MGPREVRHGKDASVTSHEDLFRSVARRLIEKERAAGRKEAWSRKEIEAQFLIEAKDSKLNLGQNSSMDMAKRVMRIQNYYQEMKDAKPDRRFIAAVDPDSPMPPRLQLKARESGFLSEGEWRYVDPREMDHAMMVFKHPHDGPGNPCPAGRISVQVSYSEDAVDYLLAFCKTCASGWWSARKPKS